MVDIKQSKMRKSELCISKMDLVNFGCFLEEEGNN